MWPAYALDGKGHHDGNGKYILHVPVEDFGEHFYLGGEVRVSLDGGEGTVFRLPSAPPAPRTPVVFRLTLDPWIGGLGYLTMVDGLEVRAPSVE